MTLIVYVKDKNYLTSFIKFVPVKFQEQIYKWGLLIAAAEDNVLFFKEMVALLITFPKEPFFSFDIWSRIALNNSIEMATFLCANSTYRDSLSLMFEDLSIREKALRYAVRSNKLDIVKVLAESLDGSVDCSKILTDAKDLADSIPCKEISEYLEKFLTSMNLKLSIEERILEAVSSRDSVVLKARVEFMKGHEDFFKVLESAEKKANLLNFTEIASYLKLISLRENLIAAVNSNNQNLVQMLIENVEETHEVVEILKTAHKVAKEAKYEEISISLEVKIVEIQTKWIDNELEKLSN